MCGIAGTLGLPDPSVTERLIRAITHRGPDHPPRLAQMPPYAASACRLSIVDVQSGQQPLLNSSKNLCISMNGEIYNHLDLRYELQNKGHVFQTHCDTEVVLHAYEEYGISVLARLEGMFAVALFDNNTETLYLIRDPLGIKPLYYLRDGKRVAYSSEIKSFFNAGIASGEVDEDYLLYRYVFNFGHANKSLFRDIHPVPPGSYVLFSKGVSREISYTSTHPPRMTPKSNIVSERRIEQLIVRSIAEQIPREVPWGVFLSGGIDSSIIAYVATVVSGAPPTLFTISDGSETNDIKEARNVARFLGTELIEIYSPVKQVIAAFPNYILALEEFEPSSIFWYMLARGAHPHVKVALCGQGADELFGGYPLYHNINLLTTALVSRFNDVKNNGSTEVRSLAAEHISLLKGEDGLSCLSGLFMRDQLTSFQLVPVDKCTMAHSLETRVPYLSKALIDCIFSLPAEIRFSGEIEKQLLRIAFAQSGLPNLWRRKQFSGRNTLPSYYDTIQDLADRIVSDEIWHNHPYLPYFKSKIEMLGFDMLLYALRECRGDLPSNFQITDLYLIRSEEVT